MESRYRNGMVNGDIVLELEKIIEALQKELTAMTADRDRWKARAEMFPTLDETLKWLDADNEVFGSAHAAFRQAIRSTYAFLKAKGKE